MFFLMLEEQDEEDGEEGKKDRKSTFNQLGSWPVGLGDVMRARVSANHCETF